MAMALMHDTATQTERSTQCGALFLILSPPAALAYNGACEARISCETVMVPRLRTGGYVVMGDAWGQITERRRRPNAEK